MLGGAPSRYSDRVLPPPSLSKPSYNTLERDFGYLIEFEIGMILYRICFQSALIDYQEEVK